MYPWGIQRLVSIHSNSNFGDGGRGGILGKWRLKVPSSDQLFIWGGAEGRGGEAEGREGGGYSRIVYSWQNEPKFWKPNLLLYLSHTTCVEKQQL